MWKITPSESYQVNKLQGFLLRGKYRASSISGTFVASMKFFCYDKRKFAPIWPTCTANWSAKLARSNLCKVHFRIGIEWPETLLPGRLNGMKLFFVKFPIDYELAQEWCETVTSELDLLLAPKVRWSRAYKIIRVCG